MQGIVRWLISMERLSGEIYRNAGRFLKNETALSAYLIQLADDESRHVEIMEQAAAHLKERPRVSEITLDDASKAKWELPFHANRNRIIAGTLTRDEMLDCIVTTESSEWNDFFQYVINALKGEGREFESAASEMEQHKRFIEAFVRALSADRSRLDKLLRLPTIWDQRILIVDDYEPMRRLIADMLSVEGFVDTASNGEEAVERITNQYFDLVITDDFMPGLNGIELYKHASRNDPGAGNHFLFLVDEIQPEHLEFIKKQDLQYLTKPFSVNAFRERVARILANTSRKDRS